MLTHTQLQSFGAINVERNQTKALLLIAYYKYSGEIMKDYIVSLSQKESEMKKTFLIFAAFLAVLALTEATPRFSKYKKCKQISYYINLLNIFKFSFFYFQFYSYYRYCLSLVLGFSQGLRLELKVEMPHNTLLEEAPICFGCTFLRKSLIIFTKEK